MGGNFLFSFFVGCPPVSLSAPYVAGDSELTELPFSQLSFFQEKIALFFFLREEKIVLNEWFNCIFLFLICELTCAHLKF